MLIFRQLFDPQSSTYTYLLADGASGQAVMIDPVYEQVLRDTALVRELGLTLAATLETHVHADHVTAAWQLKRRFGSAIMIAAASDAEGADRLLADGDAIRFGARSLQVRATPGHTGGCLTYVLDDETMAFSGDCILIRGCGRTDFQSGSARTLFRSIKSQIFSLPDSCLLYPAHDYRGLTVTSVGEERRFNPRLGGELGEDDFVGFMDNLGLAHPKQIDIAVPANLKCGRRTDGNTPGDAPGEAPDWAPALLTFAGIWEIAPDWVEEHLGDVQVIDVREPDEFTGPLGHIAGAISIPLGTLSAAVGSGSAGRIATDKPIVTVCRAGGRSAQATVILKKAGFGRVVNLAGGMLRWRALRLSVEGGSE